MFQHKISKKNKALKISIAGILVASVVTGTILHDSSTALANPSLPGIEEIVNGNSQIAPFKILEIVASYSDARIGYTIAGEEPIDITNAESINNTAYDDERVGNGSANGRYMTETGTTTTTKDTNGYKELYAGGAFLYETYAVSDESDANAKKYMAYGSFVDNAANNGRYNKVDTSGDYKKIGIDDVDTDGDGTPDAPASLDDVYYKRSMTDGTGYIYADYVMFDKAVTSTVAVNTGDRYRLSYKKVTSINSWKKPYRASTTTDSLIYYDDTNYMIDKTFGITVEDYDGDLSTDDPYYVVNPDSAIPEDGDIVYLKDGDTITYFGTFRDYDGTGLKFYPYDNDSGKANYTSTDPATGLKISDENKGDDSFATRLKNACYATEELVTMKEQDISGSGIDLYYVSSVVEDPNNGQNTRTLDEKDIVNNPDAEPATFGIYDESDISTYDENDGITSWYHTWWFKQASSQPYMYVGSGGDSDFVHDFVDGSVVSTSYYTGGYTNAEWFKTKVLNVDNDANSLSNIYIEVETKLLSDVTLDDIVSADLIYFASGDYSLIDFSSYSVAKAVISQVDGTFKDKDENDFKVNKPVIFDLSVLKSVILDDTNQLRMVGLLLMQPDVDGISNYIGDSDWKMSSAVFDNKCGPIVNAMTTYEDLNPDMSHVSRSVFINDDTKADKKSAVSSDFSTAYSKTTGFDMRYSSNSEEVIKYPGFEAVEETIEEEIFYLNAANKDLSKFDKTISKATAIRHIINYGDGRVIAKNSLRILDIEPYYNREFEAFDANTKKSSASKYLSNIYTATQNNITVTNIDEIRDIFTPTWLSENEVVSSNTSSISITGMGTKEFIGKIEDLNENYDMIYIGMDTAYMNTNVTSKKQNGKTTYQKSKEVLRNDGMNYVYSHVGDTIESHMDGVSDDNNTFTMSGNDITPDKLRELKNYVDARYAVLLSDEFFIFNSDGSIKKIDDSRVEKSSYLYDFIDWCISSKDSEGNYLYLYENVEITTNLEKKDGQKRSDGASRESHIATFSKYLNLSKLEVVVNKQPALYNPYTTQDQKEHNYLSMNQDGIYTLDFEVVLKNDAAVDTTNTTYDCKLFIDHDGDGRFEKVEELKSLNIYNVDKQSEETTTNGKFNLKTGATYTISRRVPEGYVGLLSWKLVFYENGRKAVSTGEEDDLIKVAIQDYSAISDLTNRPTIKILQITSKHNGNEENNLDLTSESMKTLYKDVIDFAIEVDSEKMENFVNNDGKGKVFNVKDMDRLDKLNEYDMLVLGFADMYAFTYDANSTKDEQAMMAIREYILSGKSVLFTHDLTSTRVWSSSSGKEWGYLAGRYLRDLQGMDRYGNVQDYLKDDGLKYNNRELTTYVSKYDNEKVNFTKTNSEKGWGFADSALLRNATNNKYGEISEVSSKNVGGNDERELYTVSRVNRGQITEYPFRIGKMTASSDVMGNYYADEFIDVAKTHHQYFQLDMETDYTDTNYDDDIVVWYTISTRSTDGKGVYYRWNFNDVRNNYYIFNKGNITYTGAGHSNIGEANLEERKLFVNTLVAAYNAGKHAPYASYKSTDSPNSADVSSLYIPYDLATANDSDASENEEWLESTVTVNFKTVNNNLQDNLHPLCTLYYVEVNSDENYSIKLASEDGTLDPTDKVKYKYYREVNPDSFKDCTDSSSGSTKNLLDNEHMYELKFNISDLMGDKKFDSRRSITLYTRMRTAKGTTDEIEDASYDADKDFADMRAVGSILPATDSFMPLTVNFTELYDLK